MGIDAERENGRLGNNRQTVRHKEFRLPRQKRATLSRMRTVHVRCGYVPCMWKLKDNPGRDRVNGPLSVLQTNVQVEGFR